MKYEVYVHELQWYTSVYTVEADSEEEAQDLIESGDANLMCSNYDCTDKMDFESFKVIEK